MGLNKGMNLEKTLMTFFSASLCHSASDFDICVEDTEFAICLVF